MAAKNQPTTEVEPELVTPGFIAGAVPEVDAEVTLEEFCVRLSMRDRRVEMIGAFHAARVAAGSIKAPEAEFASLFDAFVNQPA